MSKELHLSAMMMIVTSENFEAFVERIAKALPGITFIAEDSGRYEEIPAYEAKAGDMEFILLGIPDEDRGYDDGYRLEFCCTTQASITQLLQKSGCAFANKFIQEKSPNSRGFLDYSQELADYLSEQGIEGCRPIILSD